MDEPVLCYIFIFKMMYFICACELAAKKTSHF